MSNFSPIVNDLLKEIQIVERLEHSVLVLVPVDKLKEVLRKFRDDYMEQIKYECK